MTYNYFSICRQICRFTSLGLSLLAISLGGSDNALAYSIAGGTLTLNIDQTSLANNVNINDQPDIPSIYLEHYFSATVASTLSYSQILNNDTPTNLLDWSTNQLSSQNLQFTVNGSDLGLSGGGRSPQRNNFSFDSNNFAGTATGEIGVGGILRFRMDVQPPTNRVVIGDLALEYNPANIDTGTGQSGWSLINFFSFKSDVFDLYNVSSVITNNELNLSGQIGLADGFAHLGGNLGALVGNFSFKADVVPAPVPAPPTLISFCLSLLCWQFLQSRKGNALC